MRIKHIFLEFIHFGLVGLSGFMVDVGTYYLLQAFSFSHLEARALSFWPAVSVNWLLNRVSTFSNRKKRNLFQQWIEFVLTCCLGFCLSWGTYYLLTVWLVPVGFVFFNEYRFLALLPGMFLATVFNYAVSTLFIYSDNRS